MEVNDGGAALIKEMNERNLGIQNKDETMVVSDDEKDNKKILNDAENEKG